MANRHDNIDRLVMDADSVHVYYPGIFEWSTHDSDNLPLSEVHPWGQSLETGMAPRRAKAN